LAKNNTNIFIGKFLVKKLQKKRQAFRPVSVLTKLSWDYNIKECCCTYFLINRWWKIADPDWIRKMYTPLANAPTLISVELFTGAK
jgi:hypothetical protein